MTAATAAPRPSSEDRIRAALWFADKGFAVFSVWSTTAAGVCRCPLGATCDNAGKHPITPRGFHDATTEPDRIRTLLSAGSEPNYGLVCPEGVFALDVDGDGVAHLAELEAVHGMLPPTLRTLTAHGEHVFLRWPAAHPRPIGQLFGFVTRWGSGSGAGYVIGPRSVHASGAVYQPAGGALDIATLPESWAQAAVGATRQPVTGSTIVIGPGAYELPERVAPGDSRYGAILAYTAHLYNRGLGRDEMWPLVRDLLAPRFEESLPEAEVHARFLRTTAKLGDRLGSPAALASPPPEPIDPSTFPEPEDRGRAALSDLGTIEYVEDLIRPGRIVVWAAEEGSGKSYAVSGELAIRVACAGGSFAQTWPIVAQGPVLVLSEMHQDDDFAREDAILASLGLDRGALAGRYFRLDLMTAAGGRPALGVPEWRSWAIAWLRRRGALLLVIDTATGATQVDPWGREIQSVYANLRMMLAEYPQLAVILIVHVRKGGKGQGHAGEGRGLSDVLGEWGRWSDVVVLQENDGNSLERTKITVRKRVRHQKRVIATKAGGLLVDVVAIDTSVGSKTPVDKILAELRKHPGLTYAELGEALGVSKDTAGRYVKELGAALTVAPTGPKHANRVYLAESEPDDLREPPQTDSAAVAEHETGTSDNRRTEQGAEVADSPPRLRNLRDSTFAAVDSGPPTAAATTPSIERAEGPVAAAGGWGLTAAKPPAEAGAPDEAPEIAVEASPVDHVTCSDYGAHQSSHVRRGDGFVCLVCNPEEESSS